MENTAKLAKISKAVEENAEREAAAILDAANRRKSETLEEEKARLSDEIAAFIRDESAKIENAQRKSAVMASLELKKDLLAARGEYIDKIFETALEKIRGFTAGADYERAFAARYDKLASFSGEEWVIKIRREDEALLRKIAPNKGYEISPEIKIGGFIAESPTRALDLTLDKKYKDEMRKFVCVDAFIIDK